MELGEAGKEAKGETTAIMVSINHLIFKIFNLCQFICLSFSFLFCFCLVFELQTSI